MRDFLTSDCLLGEGEDHPISTLKAWNPGVGFQKHCHKFTYVFIHSLILLLDIHLLNMDHMSLIGGTLVSKASMAPSSCSLQCT